LVRRAGDAHARHQGRPPRAVLAAGLGHRRQRGRRARPPAQEALVKALARADQGAGARLEAAFAREERRGLMVAAATRSAAVAVIIVWLAFSNPEKGLAFAWCSAAPPSSSSPA